MICHPIDSGCDGDIASWDNNFSRRDFNVSWGAVQRLHSLFSPCGVPAGDAQIALSDAQIVLSDAQIALSDAQIVLSDAQLALSDAQIALSDAQLALRNISINFRTKDLTYRQPARRLLSPFFNTTHRIPALF